MSGTQFAGFAVSGFACYADSANFRHRIISAISYEAGFYSKQIKDKSYVIRWLTRENFPTTTPFSSKFSVDFVGHFIVESHLFLCLAETYFETSNVLLKLQCSMFCYSFDSFCVNTFLWNMIYNDHRGNSLNKFGILICKRISITGGSDTWSLWMSLGQVFYFWQSLPNIYLWNKNGFVFV